MVMQLAIAGYAHTLSVTLYCNATASLDCRLSCAQGSHLLFERALQKFPPRGALLLPFFSPCTEFSPWLTRAILSLFLYLLSYAEPPGGGAALGFLPAIVVVLTLLLAALRPSSGFMISGN